MRVWVLQTGEPVHSDGPFERPMRAINLSDALVEAGHEVVLFTPRFNHSKLSFRDVGNYTTHHNGKLTIEYIKSIGYRKNISLRRLIDHGHLAINLLSKLMRRTPPDVAFIGFPPIETALIFSQWLNWHNVPYVIDVKDQWPDVIIRAFPDRLQKIGRKLLWAHRYAAYLSIRHARAVISISDSFLQWSLEKGQRNRSKFDLVSPLTSAQLKFENEALIAVKEWWVDQFSNSKYDFKLFYVGTIGTTFDYKILTELVKNVPATFVICGEGSKLQEVKESLSKFDNVIFPGWINNIQYQSLMDFVDLCICPYYDFEDFRHSYPNKFYDAIKFGKPFITTLSGDLKNLIESKNLGLYIDSENLNFSIQQITSLLENENQIKVMARNGLDLYEKSYSLQKTYGKILKLLSDISVK
jgi:glycosyltransferase involved in cell wall biosynthesis